MQELAPTYHGSLPHLEQRGKGVLWLSLNPNSRQKVVTAWIVSLRPEAQCYLFPSPNCAHLKATKAPPLVPYHHPGCYR